MKNKRFKEEAVRKWVNKYFYPRVILLPKDWKDWYKAIHKELFDEFDKIDKRMN